MKEASGTAPPSPLWVRVAVIAVLIGLFAAYWFFTRLAPMTVLESQQALDQRIAELAVYLDPPGPLGSPELARRLGVDTGAAQQLHRLSMEKDMKDIDAVLSAPWDHGETLHLDPTFRARALAHPPLSDLLDAWVTSAVEPSDEVVHSMQYQSLLEYASEALADACDRSNEAEAALLLGRILDLIETQLGRRRLESWTRSSDMLRRLAWQLECQRSLDLADADRQTLLDRILGLKSSLATPQQASVMDRMQNLRAIRESLPGLKDDDDRASMVHAIERLRAWDEDVLAALLIEHPAQRTKALAGLEVEVGSLFRETRILASEADRLWRTYQDDRDRLDEILQHLEKP